MRRIESYEAMLDLGSEIAKHLEVGDLVVLTGELGAGKTALTQGIGRELGITGVTSPTFVISRSHNGRIPDRKSTRLNSSHVSEFRMPSSA